MRIALLQPHTHAGRHHAPGDTLELDEQTARWLIDLKVAKPLEDSPKTPTRKGD
ncbi:hypothetical protein TspCOW1_02110 [Thiohalobacter sp. COW1]|uniref:DUF7210 family protein n=1 Tax=Thiohalobacter sp. COW1 TaxID=2795687 RepID=UPI001915BDFA|nr:hypothetical protein [Thiohalobacter sp. COW1]BCO30108.1 hypothetical protein TspCOW1_02110 [Thiohalobacter sp. COW1]